MDGIRAGNPSRSIRSSVPVFVHTVDVVGVLQDGAPFTFSRCGAVECGASGTSPRRGLVRKIIGLYTQHIHRMVRIMYVIYISWINA